ncbi:oleate hydratase [Candidatus Peregrinibacteria bacterium]|jgi:oleate hydratase|nr:oleate hydratase [Candidatus Peregrinibacteria bacterium]MBT4147965.1 oleate hydratase [Candidatus Peregrinibacteria bacterium]MBT4366128.1 oleate hydratase [Candidatus Peregrinibacteria bacterium]MBT4456214.1 oleate hydratase [Candidatus Peregrinibacteria bacterium]
MSKSENRKAYIIGNGIAGLSAAVFLIKDAGMKGENITILDKNSESGGSFDGKGSARSGYLCSGYRMFERSIYSSTYDLLSNIPSLTNPRRTLKDDFLKFNQKVKIYAKARLVKNGEIINARFMELNWRDRFHLVKLLYLPEKLFESSQIRNYFTPDFFETNFWAEWSTTFAFEPWHSLVEMRRYLNRFVHDASRYNIMDCVLSAPYCEHDFFISPLLKWLEKNGVNFKYNRTVTDIEFAPNKNKKVVTAISLQNSKNSKINVNKNDLVFLTNGSITTDMRIGSMKKPPRPPQPMTKKSKSWDLWKNVAGKFEDFGNPSVFCSSIKKSQGESFTMTFHDSKFFKLVEKFSGNKAGTGGLITFKDSNWLMTIALPHQPYFMDQPKNTFVCWGYGLMPDKPGNYIKKKMSDCSGKEILAEVCFHMGFDKEASSITKSAICIPAMMPYMTSQFLPRKKADRPEVVPKGSKNLAFIGQYVEIPNEIVFTVECSVRSAKIAVKKLLKLNTKIPPLHQKKYKMKCFKNSIKTILR